jgi:hypothetical protein
VIRAGKQSGYILMPVIVVITLVAAIALLMNTESALESNTAGSELEAQQAQYVAEAGMSHALWRAQQQGCGPYSDLIGQALGDDKYTTKLTTDLGSISGYSTLVDQDSWIRSNNPSDNNAADTSLHVSSVGGNIERSLLRYDFASIPSKATILSATAWFYVDREHPEGSVDIHRITADWTETDATWDSMGDKHDSTVLATIPAQPANDVWVSVNLTAQVQAWVNGEPNYGITLNTISVGVDAEYASRESANAPYLEILVGVPPTSPATLKSVGTLANGNTRALINDDVTLVQQPGFVQLQPDAVDGKDAEIWDQAPNNNYGNADETWVSSATSDTTRSLLQFNMGAVPAGSRILQATLSLERQSGSGADQPVSAHLIRNPWSEDSVTWNERETGADWDTAGADFDNPAVATTPIGPGNQRYAWNITPLVQGWVDGSYPNYGVALVAAIPGITGERFYTSDHADPSRWPSLSITYACACGEVCVAPQGSGNLLMVVINPTTLVAEDQQAKDLFESWGYTVSVISESANQSSYDAAVAVNDVVFISETVNSNSVGTKLQNAPVGVVSQDGDYNSDLGLATGSTPKVGTDIDITSTDHYITRVFPVGPLPIYAAGMEQLVTTGAFTADQQTLAEIGGDASLVVLDKGAAMEGGGSAKGRRVILPLGTRYRFNWDYLNANGRLLVQRALEWGIGTDKVSSANLLLVVVNPSSLTTQETAKKILFESWGYTVNLIDESDNQPNFDAAVAVNDVVYITEDVASGSVNTKLVNAAIGVVTEEDNLSDEFGMAASIAWESGTQVEINDNSHYITSPFSLGLLTFLTANESLAYVTGAQSPHLGKLASSTSGYGVVTLEAGDAMFGGGSAAGRRAQLPWGGDNFDVNHLNADGLTILQRALEWGTGVDAPGPIAHWKLDETSGPTAVDSEGGNDGTLTSGPAWTPGLFQGGLDFDGSNDYVDAGTFDVSGSGITMMGWFNAEAIATDDGRIVSKANGPNAVDAWWQLSTTDSGANRYLRMRIKAGGTTTTFADSSVNLVTDRWYFAVGTYDSASGDMKLYLDGVEVASGSHAVGGAVDVDPSVPVAIGANGTAERFFNGILDDVRVYDRALSSDEIAELAKLPGPIAHWKLDETSGPTAVDSEGSHDGTWTNDPVPAPGVIDGGLDFDGSNDYVDAGTFDVSGSGITMMGWFNAEAIATDDGRIVSKANGPNEGDAWWQLSTTDAGASRFLRMRIKAGGTTTTFADNSVNLVTDQWYFAVGTYDSASGSMKLYLDGVEVRSGTHVVGGALDTNASVPVALGANGSAERFFNGILDDVRVYDYALDAGAIADYYAANPPPGTASYTEMFQQWSATSDNTWQTINLGVFGVPPDAVVEVAMTNAKDKNERWGGVRAVGSGLDRRFQLHEAEGGGVDALTLHVQADSSSRIEHFSEKKAELTFTLLGYWTGASYVELFEPFTADNNNTWVEEDLSDDGLGPNQVAEIVMLNTNGSNERLAGVRPSGASYQRRFNLHEAEAGGVDAVTMMVTTDATSIAEVFASNAADVDFHVVGYWSIPPGTYIATGGVHGQATDASTWEQADLTVFGVPADSVAQFVISSEIPNFNRELGIRGVGSGQLRVVDLHKAEAGGSEDASLHVNVDSASNIEWYSASGTADRYFYPVGWWVLSP